MPRIPALWLFAVQNIGRTRRTNVIARNPRDARVEAAKVLRVATHEVIVTPVRPFGGG